jgi:hypothetical protein
MKRKSMSSSNNVTKELAEKKNKVSSQKEEQDPCHPTSVPIIMRLVTLYKDDILSFSLRSPKILRNHSHAQRCTLYIPWLVVLFLSAWRWL